MILECLPFASQGSLSCLPGNPGKTLLKSVALRSYMQQNHGTNPYMTICKNLVLPSLCIQSCMNAHNSFTLLKMTRHMSKCNCIVACGIPVYNLPAFTSWIWYPSKIRTRRKYIRNHAHGSKHQIAFAASSQRILLHIARIEELSYHGWGIHRFIGPNYTRIGSAAFPRHFFHIINIQSRPCLLEILRPRFKESGEVFRSRKAKPWTCSTKEIMK